MRHCANRAGLAVGLIAAAAIGLTAIGTGAPASAQDDPVAPVNPLPVTPVCGGSGDIDDGGGAVFGSCFGNTPGRGPSIEVSSAQVWAWYGCDQWRAWAPGSTVSAVSSQGELVPEDILARGLDPTATYLEHRRVPSAPTARPRSGGGASSSSRPHLRSTLSCCVTGPETVSTPKRRFR